MDEENDYCLFEEPAQDWAKMIPLLVEGPWRYIRNCRGLVVERLPVEPWQASRLKMWDGEVVGREYRRAFLHE